MSIAFSTLILFFFLIPGIIYRRFYYAEEFSKEYFKEQFFGIVISAFIPSLILHAIWYFAVTLICQKVDLGIIADLITFNNKLAVIESIEFNSWKIALYNLSMFFAAGILGHYSKQIVRTNQLDRTYKLLRFKNNWHYILKGEFFDFPRAYYTLINDSVENIEFTWIDAMVEMKGEVFLYDGVLVDYELNSHGGLDTISLKDVKRDILHTDTRNLRKDDSADTGYNIPGHIVVLKYQEVKNLNFTYYKLTEIEVDKDGHKVKELKPEIVT